MSRVDPNRGQDIKEVTTRRFKTAYMGARWMVEEAMREQQRRDDSRIPNAGKRYGLKK